MDKGGRGIYLLEEVQEAIKVAKALAKWGKGE